MRLKGTVYEGCGTCKIVWEALPANAPLDVDGRPQPFAKACDNCAFRQGSPERSDPEAWEGLTMALAFQEKAFYCHKGVPLNEARDGFDYPKREDGTHPVEQLRVCAGFIAWWKGISGQRDYIPGITPRPQSDAIAEVWIDA
ncbi:MAG: hypothetical protein KAY22_25135 [Rhizorhabdus sp.]|uniref:hypothetical protein n=1 Tax=Rhizorhabdus sp. TaxID=1968843 RepID=UPI001B63DBB3|nr:hypothetical protein [Rhizorhabdus sp.]MBP8235584.1 hypothetical protein [Rhizorhabdus sp.]